jgi:hypothetical protein
LQALKTFAIIRALRQCEQNVMVASMGPLATIDGKFRQAWKGATVAIDSCAGVWLVGVHHQFLLFVTLFTLLFTLLFAPIFAPLFRHSSRLIIVFLIFIHYPSRFHLK